MHNYNHCCSLKKMFQLMHDPAICLQHIKQVACLPSLHLQAGSKMTFACHTDNAEATAMQAVLGCSEVI